MSTSPIRKQLLSIGDVIQTLNREFPDLSISKIRFLESEGLINPYRAPSGYRKFTEQDLDRIRYILELQHLHYLPLKVIKDHLVAVDSGREKVIKIQSKESLSDRLKDSDSLSNFLQKQISIDTNLTKQDFADICRISINLLDELVDAGLLTMNEQRIPASQIEVTRVILRLHDLGVPFKHLRPTKIAANREFSLSQALVKPLREKKIKQSKQRADELMIEILGELSNLSRAYIASQMRDELS